jgi:hypothetical protein
MCLRHNSDNCAVKKYHSWNAKPHQRHYYKVKCLGAKCLAMTLDYQWQYAFHGGARYRKIELLSDEASCYTVVVFIPCSLQWHSHCLKLQTYYCKSVDKILLDMPDREVNIIVTTDGYSTFLSVPVWIPVACRFFFCVLWVLRVEEGPRDLEFLHHGS